MRTWYWPLWVKGQPDIKPELTCSMAQTVQRLQGTRAHTHRELIWGGWGGQVERVRVRRHRGPLCSKLVAAYKRARARVLLIPQNLQLTPHKLSAERNVGRLANNGVRAPACARCSPRSGVFPMGLDWGYLSIYL